MPLHKTQKPDPDARYAGARADQDRARPTRRAPLPAGLPEAAETMAPDTPTTRFAGYAAALAGVLLTTLLATPLLPHFDPANIVMLFLLTVVLVAARYGRGPAMLATLTGVAFFDFFFVQPRFSFGVSDLQYVLTFAVMLAVGLITAHLTANLRFQARVASARELRSHALYEFARALSGVLETGQIFDITRDAIQCAFLARAVLLLPDSAGRLQAPLSGPDNHIPGGFDLGGIDLGVAQWAFDKASAAGLGTDTQPATRCFYLPLVAPMRTRGVLAIRPEGRRWLLLPEQRQQLDTFAALAAIALERVHYIDVARDALVRMESERLRNSLLAALSHDLRTPLTSLVGLAESLTLSRPALAPAQLSLAQGLHEEALRMASLVANLLDMARIQSGEIRLNRQWQPIEEVVGSALRASASLLGRHVVETRIPASLPLVHFDAVLIERVLCNLLQNAAKYTPPGSRIALSASAGAGAFRVAVSDNGPGLPHGQEEMLFEKFVRGERESATPGMGLGLAICRAIIEAHGGVIHAANGQEGGAQVEFVLPLGAPPTAPESEEVDYPKENAR